VKGHSLCRGCGKGETERTGRRDRERERERERERTSEKGNLEDCASPVRCSACGGLLFLEVAERREGCWEEEEARKRKRKRRDNKERRGGKERRRGKRHVVNHGPVAPMYYILSLSAESGPVHATALWRTMFNHLSVDSFGFN